MSLSVAFVCHEYPPGLHGGIGSCTQTLARALVAAGHRARVIGVYAAGHAAPDEDEDQGVAVHRLRWPSHPARAAAMRVAVFRQLAAWARSGAIDLIELPDYQGWGAGWPALPVPVVARLNGSSTYFNAEMGRPLRRLDRLLEGASLRRADFVTSVSRYTARRTAAIFGLTATDDILPNPVDLSPEPPLSHRRVPRRVLFTGTLTMKKGVASLIAAWPAVVAAVPGATLRLVGKDGLDAGGHSMASGLQSRLPLEVRGSVTFVGHVPKADVMTELAEASVAVFPSYAEAFAIAPIEAMSCGCPTIYTRRGSGSELIAHGETGWLIDPDDTADIARAIVHVLTDPASAGRVGRAGARSVQESFEAGRLAAANVSFYERCIERFRARHADDPPSAITAALLYRRASSRNAR